TGCASILSRIRQLNFTNSYSVGCYAPHRPIDIPIFDCRSVAPVGSHELLCGARSVQHVIEVWASWGAAPSSTKIHDGRWWRIALRFGNGNREPHSTGVFSCHVRPVGGHCPLGIAAS